MDPERVWRWVQLAAAASPFLTAALLFWLGKHFPGRKEVVSPAEVKEKIDNALKDERLTTISRLELQNLLNVFAKERDKYVEEVAHASREASTTAMLGATATLREKVERVEGEVGSCRTDMDVAKERAAAAASGVEQLKQKIADTNEQLKQRISDMDERLKEKIDNSRDVLLAKLDAIEARLERNNARTRKDDP